MNTTTASPLSVPLDAPAAARTALKLLQRITHGTLTLQLPDGSIQCFGNGGQPHAAISLKNWNVCQAALKSGDIGFAESYIAGDWTTPSLTDLLKVFIRNRKDVEDVIYGTWAGRLLYRLKHLLNRNTRSNSQKNIHAHYDLGNAFYSLWLDGTMNYSSAWFEGDTTQPMQQAQHAKVRRALRMAGVREGDRVLEIGCGWGALAEMATTEFAARLTGVTLSTEQLAFAQDRMERLGTSGQADLRLQDYRDIQDGPYDAICSIEMVEAVGREYWPTYFESVARLLKPGGRACVQSIVIDDACSSATWVRPTSFSSTSSPGAACPAHGSSVHKPRVPDSQWWTNLHSVPTMQRRCGAGATSFWPNAPGFFNSVLTKGSSAYGSSISPTARRPSIRPISTWCSTRYKNHSALRNDDGGWRPV
jgi:cyclopropane-fatty-acyl-phospholipid synthase